MAADVVITGIVLTVDDARPTAEALAVADGRIIAVGNRSDIAGLIGPTTRTIDVGDGCVMPGLVEAHGHPLLQSGLPQPTLAWLDEIGPDGPLAIMHNSGHKAYFNSHAARLPGLTRDTPDPKGARYGRDADGELDGTAEETAAVFPLLGAAIEPSAYPDMLRAECARLNRAGLTICSEMAFDPAFRPLVEQAIRAQTIDAAWQLFADDVVGSLEVGKYADLVVLSADPRTVPPERIADLDVRATFLAGRQVYPQ